MALAWLKAQGPQHGIDPTRLVLIGRSAGGQIATAVGYLGDPDGDRIDNNDGQGVGGTTADADYVLAGAGNDSIFTENGSDTVYGGDGDDTAYASTDGDLVYGGAGNDLLVIDSGGSGPGATVILNRLSYDATRSIEARGLSERTKGTGSEVTNTPDGEEDRHDNGRHGRAIPRRERKRRP